MSFIEEIFDLLRTKQRSEFERDPYAAFVLSVLRKFVIIVIALTLAVGSVYTATNFFEVIYVVSTFVDDLGRSLGL